MDRIVVMVYMFAVIGANKGRRLFVLFLQEIVKLKGDEHCE